MTPERIKARNKQLATCEEKPGYFETSHARQKRRRDAKVYVDRRARVA